MVTNFSQLEYYCKEKWGKSHVLINTGLLTNKLERKSQIIWNGGLTNEQIPSHLLQTDLRTASVQRSRVKLKARGPNLALLNILFGHKHKIVSLFLFRSLYLLQSSVTVVNFIFLFFKSNNYIFSDIFLN